FLDACTVDHVDGRNRKRCLRDADAAPLLGGERAKAEGEMKRRRKPRREQKRHRCRRWEKARAHNLVCVLEARARQQFRTTSRSSSTPTAVTAGSVTCAGEIAAALEAKRA